jgi:hypothetical protein
MVNRELAELWTSVNHSSPQERRADIERVIAEIERSVRIESNGVLRLHGVEEQLRLAICAGGSSPSEDVPSISPR